MQNHNDDTIKTSDTVLRKIYLSLYLKELCVRGSWDRTELQHIDPHSIGHNHVSSRSPGLLNRGPGGPASLGAGFLYCILSPTRLIPNSSDLQTDWISCALSYIIVQHHLLLVGVTNCTHSTHPRSRLYTAIPRPDAPVIYTGAFPILTAPPGRRSIYNMLRDRTLLISVLFITLNNLIVRFKFWSFGERGVVLSCHCSQVHSGPEW